VHAKTRVEVPRRTHYFVERAVRAGSYRDGLGDVRATRARISGANSPYGLLTHCLGVLEYGRESSWLVAVCVATDGRVRRHGTVDELLARVEASSHSLPRSRHVRSDAPLRALRPVGARPDRPLTQERAAPRVRGDGATSGQMEILRDLLLNAAAGPATLEPFPDYRPRSRRIRGRYRWLRSKRGVKWSRPGADRLPAWVPTWTLPSRHRSDAIEATLGRGISATRTGRRTPSLRRSLNGWSALRLDRRSSARARHHGSDPGGPGVVALATEPGRP